MGYLKAHVQEGRNWGSDLVTRIPMKAEDLTYSETASALGTITTFNKQFGYASQIAGPLPTWVD